MPLKNSSSDKARSENLATEVRAGKDPKQAAAIAYATQRRAKAKGYNAGGAADGDWAGLASDNAVEPGAQSTEDLQASDEPTGPSATSRFGKALSALGAGSKPSAQPPPTVSVKNVLGQQQFGSGYAKGGEVQVGEPKLEQGQLGNEVRLPEMPITVESPETRLARLRSEDRPVEHDEAGNALAAGLVGGAGTALRSGARALGSALGRQVVDPDKTAEIAIPPLRQLQAEAAKRLAARGAAKAGESYVPPPGYAMGGQVEAVHNHPSASLRWPLAHLTERGRRQASYQLGMHLQHHFSSGGMAGDVAEAVREGSNAPSAAPTHEDVSRTRAKYGIGEHYGTKDETAAIAASAHNKSAPPTTAEVERVAAKYGQRAPEAPEALRDPNAVPGARTWNEYKASHPNLMQEDMTQPLGVIVPEAQYGEKRPVMQHAEHNPAMEHDPNAVGLGRTMRATDYAASRNAQQAAAKPAAAKPAEAPHESPQTAPAPTPAETAPKLSTEDQIEKERQEERQAALHPGVLDSIRRHVSNGLLAFGGKGIVDYGAQDAAAAKEANENALQRLNVLHGNQDQAHKLAEQSPESPRAAALRMAVAKTLGVPSSQFANIAPEDMKDLSSLAVQYNSARTAMEREQARLAMEDKWKAVQAGQGERRLGIEQQKANASKQEADTKQTNQEDTRLSQFSRQLTTTLQPIRRTLNAADNALATLDEIQKPGQATQGNVHLFLNELDKLSSGGAATQYGIEGLDSQTVQSRLAAMHQAITGAPTDTGKAQLMMQYRPFIKQLQMAQQHAYQKSVDDVAHSNAHLSHIPRFHDIVEQSRSGRMPEEAPAAGKEDDVDQDVVWTN